jgi:O-antigen ligase
MRRRLTDSSRNAVPTLFLLLSILLGGASGVGAGSLANGILQMVSLALILYCLWARRDSALPAEAKLPLWIGLVFLLAVLLSLAPLPASLWQQLPGRVVVSRGLALVGTPDVPLASSLAPQATLDSVVWLLPPLAGFLLVLRAPYGARKPIAAGLLLVAILSAGLGIAQLLSGPMALKPYEVSNPGLPVGFFANANHLGTLLVCALPFAGYFAARAVQRSDGAKKGSGVATGVTTGLFLVVGVVSIGSLAGIGLLLVAGAATFLIYRRASRGRLGAAWVAGVGLLFLVFVGVAVSGPLQQQALTGKITDQRTSRKVMAATTIVAIKDSFPAGTGLGSFAQAYRTYEDEFAVGSELVNHAHNDYLEFVMEMGLAGLLLLIAFLFWWIRRSVSIWRSRFEGADLGRAGSIVILVVLLHSIVDYPIRTSAIAVLFAMACALMVPPPARSRRARDRREDSKTDAPELRHLEAN